MTDPQLLVWLDPGQTTGAAWLDLRTYDFGSWEYDRADVERKLRSLSERYPGELMAVGCERYLAVGGPRSGTPKHSLEVIGMVKSLETELGFQVRHPVPSVMRKIATPVYLRRLGWYKPGKQHARDASQHLLADLMRMKPMPTRVRHKLFPEYYPDATIAP